MDAITSLSNSSNTTATDPLPIGEPAPNASLDKDAFLKLLVAQLKYQDPTAPTDVSQMMAQTSQLTMVERLDEISAGIDRLGGSAPLSNAASMLGREITFDAGGLAPITATVDAVRLVEGEVVLSAGGYDVPMGALLEIKGAGATPTITTTGADGTTTGDGTTETTETTGPVDSTDTGTTGSTGTDTDTTGGDSTDGDIVDDDTEVLGSTHSHEH